MLFCFLDFLDFLQLRAVYFESPTKTKVLIGFGRLFGDPLERVLPGLLDLDFFFFFFSEFLQFCLFVSLKYINIFLEFLQLRAFLTKSFLTTASFSLV